MIERLERELIEVNHKANPVGGSLVKCPFIVGSEDLMYTINDNGRGFAGVAMDATFPMQLEKDSAYRLAQTFYAENGKGPIVWKVFTEREWYAAKAIEIENNIKLFKSLIQ